MSSSEPTKFYFNLDYNEVNDLRDRILQHGHETMYGAVEIEEKPSLETLKNTNRLQIIELSDVILPEDKKVSTID